MDRRVNKTVDFKTEEVICFLFPTDSHLIFWNSSNLNKVLILSKTMFPEI